MSDTTTDVPRESSSFVIILLGLVSIAVIICLLILCFCKKPKKVQIPGAQADQRINNISSSVPGQNPPHYPDAYLSVEHIMVANELNKSPKYNEAPPSYEEAMKLAMAHSNSIQTYQAEQAQSGQQLEATSATTSTTPIAVTHQPSAVPNERF